MAGETVSHYRIEAKLGEGGRGAVSPNSVTPTGDAISFDIRVGDSRSTWRIPVSADSDKVAAAPGRFTAGTTFEQYSRFSPNGDVAFAEASLNHRI